MCVCVCVCVCACACVCCCDIVYIQGVIPLLKTHMSKSCSVDLLRQIRQLVMGLVFTQEKEQVCMCVLWHSSSLYIVTPLTLYKNKIKGTPEIGTTLYKNEIKGTPEI